MYTQLVEGGTTPELREEMDRIVREEAGVPEGARQRDGDLDRRARPDLLLGGQRRVAVYRFPARSVIVFLRPKS